MNDPRQKLHILDSRVESRVKAIRADHDWWPCRRGCDHCCRHLACPPELSHHEWVRIEEAIALLAPPVRNEIEKKIDALLVQIAEDTVGQYVVCPYLDNYSGSCLIYDARPIASRTYGFFVPLLFIINTATSSKPKYFHVVSIMSCGVMLKRLVMRWGESVEHRFLFKSIMEVMRWQFAVNLGFREPQMDADKRRFRCPKGCESAVLSYSKSHLR